MSTATCPFCNAELPPLPAASANERVPCPRCGEPVPASRFPVGPAATSHAPSADPTEMQQRKRATLFLLLGIMGGMALIALIFALMTIDLRRSRDPKVKAPKPDEKQVAKQFVAPASLTGL